MDWNNLSGLSSILNDANPQGDAYSGTAQIFTVFLENYWESMQWQLDYNEWACEAISDILHEWSCVYDWEENESSCTENFALNHLASDYFIQDMEDKEFKIEFVTFIKQFIANTSFTFHSFLVYRCWLGQFRGDS